MSRIFNIADYLPQMAERQPHRVAIHMPMRRRMDGGYDYHTWTFKKLDEEADRYAHGLTSLGVGKGTRTLLMVRPGFDLIALTFALFKTGATPVLIDPGMGKKNLLDCVKTAEPEAMVAVPLAHAARLLYPGYFRSVKHTVTVGRRWLWGGTNAKNLRLVSGKAFETVPTGAEDMAAILFTTGSTGPPKGVVYGHGVFNAQLKIIREQYHIAPGDVDLPAFSLFALFSIALGAGVVIPDMDPTRPAQASSSMRFSPASR